MGYDSRLHMSYQQPSSSAHVTPFSWHLRKQNSFANGWLTKLTGFYGQPPSERSFEGFDTSKTIHSPSVQPSKLFPPPSRSMSGMPGIAPPSSFEPSDSPKLQVYPSIPYGIYSPGYHPRPPVVSPQPPGFSPPPSYANPAELSEHYMPAKQDPVYGPPAAPVAPPAYETTKLLRNNYGVPGRQVLPPPVYPFSTTVAPYNFDNNYNLSPGFRSEAPDQNSEAYASTTYDISPTYKPPQFEAPSSVYSQPPVIAPPGFESLPPGRIADNFPSYKPPLFETPGSAVGQPPAIVPPGLESLPSSRTANNFPLYNPLIISSSEYSQPPAIALPGLVLSPPGRIAHNFPSYEPPLFKASGHEAGLPPVMASPGFQSLPPGRIADNFPSYKPPLLGASRTEYGQPPAIAPPGLELSPPGRIADNFPSYEPSLFEAPSSEVGQPPAIAPPGFESLPPGRIADNFPPYEPPLFEAPSSKVGQPPAIVPPGRASLPPGRTSNDLPSYIVPIKPLAYEDHPSPKPNYGNTFSQVPAVVSPGFRASPPGRTGGIQLPHMDTNIPLPTVFPAPKPSSVSDNVGQPPARSSPGFRSASPGRTRINKPPGLPEYYSFGNEQFENEAGLLPIVPHPGFMDLPPDDNFEDIHGELATYHFNEPSLPAFLSPPAFRSLAPGGRNPNNLPGNRLDLDTGSAPSHRPPGFKTLSPGKNTHIINTNNFGQNISLSQYKSNASPAKQYTGSAVPAVYGHPVFRPSTLSAVSENAYGSVNRSPANLPPAIAPPGHSLSPPPKNSEPNYPDQNDTKRGSLSAISPPSYGPSPPATRFRTTYAIQNNNQRGSLPEIGPPGYRASAPERKVEDNIPMQYSNVKDSPTGIDTPAYGPSPPAINLATGYALQNDNQRGSAPDVGPPGYRASAPERKVEDNILMQYSNVKGSPAGIDTPAYGPSPPAINPATGYALQNDNQRGSAPEIGPPGYRALPPERKIEVNMSVQYPNMQESHPAIASGAHEPLSLKIHSETGYFIEGNNPKDPTPAISPPAYRLSAPEGKIEDHTPDKYPNNINNMRSLPGIAPASFTFVSPVRHMESSSHHDSAEALPPLVSRPGFRPSPPSISFGRIYGDLANGTKANSIPAISASGINPLPSGQNTNTYVDRISTAAKYSEIIRPPGHRSSSPGRNADVYDDGHGIVSFYPPVEPPAHRPVLHGNRIGTDNDGQYSKLPISSIDHPGFGLLTPARGSFSPSFRPTAPPKMYGTSDRSSNIYSASENLFVGTISPPVTEPLYYPGATYEANDEYRTGSQKQSEKEEIMRPPLRPPSSSNLQYGKPSHNLILSDHALVPALQHNPSTGYTLKPFSSYGQMASVHVDVKEFNSGDIQLPATESAYVGLFSNGNRDVAKQNPPVFWPAAPPKIQSNMGIIQHRTDLENRIPPVLDLTNGHIDFFKNEGINRHVSSFQPAFEPQDPSEDLASKDSSGRLVVALPEVISSLNEERAAPGFYPQAPPKIVSTDFGPLHVVEVTISTTSTSGSEYIQQSVQTLQPTLAVPQVAKTHEELLDKTLSEPSSLTKSSTDSVEDTDNQIIRRIQENLYTERTSNKLRTYKGEFVVIDEGYLPPAPFLPSPSAINQPVDSSEDELQAHQQPNLDNSGIQVILPLKSESGTSFDPGTVESIEANESVMEALAPAFIPPMAVMDSIASQFESEPKEEDSDIELTFHPLASPLLSGAKDSLWSPGVFPEPPPKEDQRGVDSFRDPGLIPLAPPQDTSFNFSNRVRAKRSDKNAKMKHKQASVDGS